MTRLGVVDPEKRLLEKEISFFIVNIADGSHPQNTDPHGGMTGIEKPNFLEAVLEDVVGIQFIVSGVLADIMLKVYYGQNSRKNYLIEKVIE